MRLVNIPINVFEKAQYSRLKQMLIFVNRVLRDPLSFCEYHNREILRY